MKKLLTILALILTTLLSSYTMCNAQEYHYKSTEYHSNYGNTQFGFDQVKYNVQGGVIMRKGDSLFFQNVALQLLKERISKNKVSYLTNKGHYVFFVYNEGTLDRIVITKYNQKQVFYIND